MTCSLSRGHESGWYADDVESSDLGTPGPPPLDLVLVRLWSSWANCFSSFWSHVKHKGLPAVKGSLGPVRGAACCCG